MREYILVRGAALSSIAIRMAMSVGLIATVAALYPAEEFGKFGIAFGAGQLVGLLSSLGFQIALIRDGARELPCLRPRTSAALLVKTIAALVIIFPISRLALGPIEETSQFLPFFILIIAIALGSYGDLLYSVLRALKGIKPELTGLVVSSFFLLIGIALIAVLDGTIVHIIWALIATRSAYTAMAVMSFLHAFPVHANAKSQNAYQYFIQNLSLALEGIVVNTINQIDSILVANTLGFELAGIYQAGARIAYGVFPIAAMLNSLTIPKVARAHQNRPETLWSAACSCLIEYSILAIFFSLFLLFIGPLYSKLLLDESYGPVNNLWPLFSVYILIKICASGMGVFLSVIHAGWFRLATLLAILLSYIVLIPIIGERFSIEGVIYVAIGTATFQIIAFAAIIYVELSHPHRRMPPE